jgi:hypothetical protein
MSIARRVPQPPERWIIHGRLPQLLAKTERTRVRADGHSPRPEEPDASSGVWQVGEEPVRANDPHVRAKHSAR